MRALTVVLVLSFGATVAVADPCPENLQYKGGSYLKRGGTYYYEGGSFLLRDGTLYYPGGTYLKRDATVYYPNGSYLQRQDALYYPSGAFLKRANRYYYANGAFLKRDENFYYGNGAFARRNGTLYRPDGSITAFPIQLSETIAGYGRLTAEVSATSDRVDVDFRDLLISAKGVSLNALWDGQVFTRFELLMNTGVPGEDIFVTVQSNTVDCRLGGGIGPAPSTFWIEGAAGSAQVTVRPGHDPVRLRTAVKAALDGGRR